MEEILKLIDVAAERIRQYLPEDYEIDDISWSDTGFVLPIFNARTIEDYRKGPVEDYGEHLYFVTDCKWPVRPNVTVPDGMPL